MVVQRLVRRTGLVHPQVQCPMGTCPGQQEPVATKRSHKYDNVMGQEGGNTRRPRRSTTHRNSWLLSNGQYIFDVGGSGDWYTCLISFGWVAKRKFLCFSILFCITFIKFMLSGHAWVIGLSDLCVVCNWGHLHKGTIIQPIQHGGARDLCLLYPSPPQV